MPSALQPMGRTGQNDPVEHRYDCKVPDFPLRG
jgi:hypothetical protein